jgi:hypothetical protein
MNILSKNTTNPFLYLVSISSLENSTKSNIQGLISSVLTYLGLSKSAALGTQYLIFITESSLPLPF